MASITAPISAPQRKGAKVAIPVAAATHLYPGGLIARDTAGRAVPASDTAGLRVAGRGETDADNSTGAAGDLTVTVGRGTFRYANSGTDPLTRADEGNVAFVEDDATVCRLGGTNKVNAGRVVTVDADGVWIDTSKAGGARYTLTSAQNATAAASDAGSTQALTNSLKTSLNALQADVAGLLGIAL